MLALFCTLVFAAAATLALASIVLTMQGRRAQIAALIADYRSLRQDREFLVTMTCPVPGSARAPAPQIARRTARRPVRQAEAVRNGRALRAAA